MSEKQEGKGEGEWEEVDLLIEGVKREMSWFPEKREVVERVWRLRVGWVTAQPHQRECVSVGKQVQFTSAYMFVNAHNNTYCIPVCCLCIMSIPQCRVV